MWLEDGGYVHSPHVSAGRVPTGYGYRAFVNNLLLDVSSLAAGETPFVLEHGLLSAADRVAVLVRLAQLLANYTQCLALLALPQVSSMVIERGMPLLLAQPEFADASQVIPLLSLLEDRSELHTLLAQVAEHDGLAIDIGQEMQAFSLMAFSLVGMRVAQRSGQGTAGVVAVFGPMRMDYQRAIIAVSAVAGILAR
jgi:transcriptional regulator of heat shock response